MLPRVTDTWKIQRRERHAGEIYLLFLRPIVRMDVFSFNMPKIISKNLGNDAQLYGILGV